MRRRDASVGGYGGGLFCWRLGSLRPGSILAAGLNASHALHATLCGVDPWGRYYYILKLSRSIAKVVFVVLLSIGFSSRGRPLKTRNTIIFRIIFPAH